MFEPISGLPNIIPILDSGEWQSYYVLVMPRAAKSLRKHLSDTGGKLDPSEAVSILIDVAEALAGLQQGVVHRDLKPDNVLLYQGRWCLADFGIARYAAATTAPDTHKYAFTAPYASPEQWRFEHATPAADAYAFGAMAFELIQGQWPFGGPDFRDQHLNQAAPALTTVSPGLASIVAECLYKAPQARPTPASIVRRLRASQQPPSPAAASLQAANQQVVAARAQDEAGASAARSVEETRQELLAVARQSFQDILEALIEQALDAAPATAVSRGNNVSLQLGQGALIIDPIQLAPAKPTKHMFGSLPFDVIAYTAIAARKPRDQYGYEGRAHSLWFCDAHDEGVYRWFETAFMVMALIPKRFTLDPFALPPTDTAAVGAFAPGGTERQVAWQPLPFDQGEAGQFIDRWLGWFAAAASGTLTHPSVQRQAKVPTWRQ